MDIINLYPKTSCPCEYCLSEYPIPSEGPKSNLSVRGCEISPYFECYDRVELQNNIQPVEKTGESILNPQAYTNKVDPSFKSVKCGCPISSCPDTVYISANPKQYSAVRAEYLPLGLPPTNGDVRLKNVYNNSQNYRTGFIPYDKIADGDITYYVDKSIEDPYFKPVFSEPAKVSSRLFKDPMGAMKPEYSRDSLVNKANPITDCRGDYPYCLSFLQDTQSQREDIMALQQAKHNQQKWTARWATMSS